MANKLVKPGSLPMISGIEVGYILDGNIYAPHKDGTEDPPPEVTEAIGKLPKPPGGDGGGSAPAPGGESNTDATTRMVTTVPTSPTGVVTLDTIPIPDDFPGIQAIRAAGYTTIGELMKVDVSKITGVGPKTQPELQARLDEYGK